MHYPSKLPESTSCGLIVWQRVSQAETERREPKPWAAEKAAIGHISTPPWAALPQEEAQHSAWLRDVLIQSVADPGSNSDPPT